MITDQIRTTNPDLFFLRNPADNPIKLHPRSPYSKPQFLFRIFGLPTPNWIHLLSAEMCHETTRLSTRVIMPTNESPKREQAIMLAKTLGVSMM